MNYYSRSSLAYDFTLFEEDEARLKELRREQSDEIIAAFFSSLRGLGMNREEIQTAVADWIAKHGDSPAPPGEPPAAQNTGGK